MPNLLLKRLTLLCGAAAVFFFACDGIRQRSFAQVELNSSNSKGKTNPERFVLPNGMHANCSKMNSGAWAISITSNSSEVLSYEDWEYVVCTFHERGGIEFLNLENLWIAEDAFKSVNTKLIVKKLSITASNCNDCVIKQLIAQMPMLEAVYIQSGFISDESLFSLSTLRLLRELTVTRCPLVSAQCADRLRVLARTDLKVTVSDDQEPLKMVDAAASWELLGVIGTVKINISSKMAAIRFQPLNDGRSGFLKIGTAFEEILSHSEGTTAIEFDELMCRGSNELPDKTLKKYKRLVVRRSYLDPKLLTSLLRRLSIVEVLVESSPILDESVIVFAGCPELKRCEMIKCRGASAARIALLRKLRPDMEIVFVDAPAR